MLFLINTGYDNKIKKRQSIIQQYESLKWGHAELLTILNKKRIGLNETKLSVAHFKQKLDTSKKRSSIIKYHISNIDQLMNIILKEQRWVTETEHSFLYDSKSFWEKESIEIKNHITYYNSLIHDYKLTYDQQIATIEGINKGLSSMNEEYKKLGIILNHLNIDINENKKSHFKKSLSTTLKKPPSTCANFIQFLLKTKIVPCSINQI